MMTVRGAGVVTLTFPPTAYPLCKNLTHTPVLVRFRASRYVPPQRVGYNLSERRQRVLQILGEGVPLPLREIQRAFADPVPTRTLTADLSFLRELELVDRSGAGRAARWYLRGTS